jgi:hypothetical protein
VSSGDEGTSVTTDDELIDQLHQPAGHSAHGMGGGHSLGDMESFTTLSLDESQHVGGNSSYHVPLDGHHETEDEEDKHEETASSEQS